MVLISHYSAEARRLDAEDVLMGPRRQLLATRTVSGKITWADNAAPIVGATIKAYDNDVIGSDYMGSTSTNSDGKLEIFLFQLSNQPKFLLRLTK